MMGLRNDVTADLTVAQIAAHLQTNPWNITRELQKAAAGEKPRLQGRKVFTEGPGCRGQWRVRREDYLDRLHIPHTARGDADHLDEDGLPTLTPLLTAANQLGISAITLKALVRQHRWPHVTFGYRQYFTHHQLARLLVLTENERAGQADTDAGTLVASSRVPTREGPGAEE